MIPLEKHIKSSLNNAGLLPPSSRSSGSEMASFLCSGKSSVTLLRFSRVPALSLSRFQSHRVALSSFNVKPLAVTLALGRLRLALQRTAPLHAEGLTRTELPWLHGPSSEWQHVATPSATPVTRHLDAALLLGSLLRVHLCWPAPSHFRKMSPEFITSRQGL